MYIYLLGGINFASFYNFLLDFRTVLIVWYLSFVTFLLVYIIKPVSSVLYIYVRTVGYLRLFIRMSIKTCEQGSLCFRYLPENDYCPAKFITR